MNSIWITIKKELRSMFRDKKTLYTLLIFPVLIPAFIFMYGFIFESGVDEENYVIGVNYELNTTEKALFEEVYLEGKYYDDLEKMKEAYSKGEIVGYIDYLEEEEKYTLYVNEDSEEGMSVSNCVSMYLDSYNQYLGKLQLIGEDIDVEAIYDNFSYEVVNLEGENWILALMFSMAFTYIVMSIALATTNMATTATAVEKENGTMETLLTFPIRSRDLVIGKYLATVIMGMLTAFIGLVLTVGSLELVTTCFESLKDITYSIRVDGVFISILILLLASGFISGLSIAITSFAKSYKEAQSSSSVLNIIMVVPMMISMFGVEIERWYYLIPIFNYTQILMDIFSGNIDLVNVGLVVLSSIVCVVLVITYIIRQYRSEKVLFGIE